MPAVIRETQEGHCHRGAVRWEVGRQRRLSGQVTPRQCRLVGLGTRGEAGLEGKADQKEHPRA